MQQAPANRPAPALPPEAYSALVDALPDIVMVFSTAGQLVYINSAVTRLLGYPPDEVLGRSVFEFLHPDDRPQARARMMAVTTAGGTDLVAATYRLRSREGDYRQIEMLSVNRLGEPGLQGICVTGRDVTRRVAAEERRRLAAREARIGIFEWNTETHELIADEPVRALARQQPDQRWTGPAEFVQRFLPEDRPAVIGAIEAATKRRGSGRAVGRIALPDGSLRWLYLYAQPRQAGAGDDHWMLGLIMDVTELKRAEQEISRRGELLELASWGADVGVWTWFPAEDRAIIDERSARLLGLPPGEPTRTTAECNAPVHPDDLPELLRLEAALIEGASDVFDYAYRVRRDDGWGWILDRGRVSERDKAGRAVRVSGVTLDIDEAKRRETELDEQRLRLGLALRASQLGIWDFDVVRDELFVDQRYTEIVGLSAEVVRRGHRQFDQIIHEADRPRLIEAARDCFAGRSASFSFEGRLLKSDGRLGSVRLEGLVARLQPDGLPARVIGTIADTSEARRVAQMTRVGELVAGLGSYEFDVGTDRFFWSDGIYRMFGFPTDFIPARGATADLLLPSSKTVMLDAFRAAREQGREFDVEVEANTARGRHLWVRMIGRVESFKGRPVRVFGIVQDITERKTLEAALLEASNREQQKLGSDLHDGLGQELTGISLLLQGLAQQAKAANPALAAPFDRLSNLLSGAIRSTRMLAHGLAPVSLGRGGIVGALRMLADQSAAMYSIPVDVELNLDTEPQLGEVAGNHLYRIAQEALSNAVRHGGATSVTLRLHSSESALALEIVDDGCGIPEADARTTGLGLRSMTYRAQSIGGSLEIAPLPRGGTRVFVSIPQSNG